MKAILTKYVGPTNTKGSKIIAYDCDGNKVSIDYPQEKSQEEKHRSAASALCKQMNWSGTLICGSIKDGYAFVFLD